MELMTWDELTLEELIAFEDCLSDDAGAVEALCDALGIDFEDLCEYDWGYSWSDNIEEW